MLEEGTVVEIDGSGKALVSIDRKKACFGCCACAAGAGGKMSVKAENPANAGVNDKVKIEIRTKGLVLGMVLTYLLPALCLIMGIILGSNIAAAYGAPANAENIGIFTGVIFAALSFPFTRGYGRKKIIFSARVVEILR